MKLLLLIAMMAMVEFSTFAQQGPVIPAADLVEIYEANEVLCDEKFKGRRVSVRGTIHNIGKDILGTPYVTFVGPENSLFKTQCMFTKSDTQILMNLLPGRTITISGIVKGKMMNVLLGDCEIVQ